MTFNKFSKSNDEYDFLENRDSDISCNPICPNCDYNSSIIDFCDPAFQNYVYNNEIIESTDDCGVYIYSFKDLGQTAGEIKDALDFYIEIKARVYFDDDEIHKLITHDCIEYFFDDDCSFEIIEQSGKVPIFMHQI